MKNNGFGEGSLDSSMAKSAPVSSLERAKRGSGSREQPVLDQSVLNIDSKVRRNLFPWRGQFSPQLVEAHLRAYSTPRQVVLDPFVGSGTVLVECARRGNAAYGAEVNPAAATMARTYELAVLSHEERTQLLAQIDGHIKDLVRLDDLPLFSRGKTVSDLRSSLLEYVKNAIPGTSERKLLETLVVILDFHSGALTSDRLARTWKKLRHLVEGLPHATEPIAVFLSDARRLPLPDESVDFVITSPPYVNVFNYHQQFRASVEALDWRILPIARSEIGSNRKHRSNRFLTVIQYCLDMAQVFLELSRVCRPGARAIVVVGRESNVRKTPFFNGEILRRLAHECLGFPVLLEQERAYTNRFGQRIYEDLLHFAVLPTTAVSLERRARSLAAQLLQEAMDRAPDESLQDLRDALERVDTVHPSPIACYSAQPSALVQGFHQGWDEEEV